ncbi:hypothetical protein Tco_0397260 [Tanacetum coccineum]
MGYLARAYYSISPTKYYKDDSCWSADLKSNTTEDVELFEGRKPLSPLQLVVEEVIIVMDDEVLLKDLTMVEKSTVVEYEVKTVVDTEEWCTKNDSY